MRKKGEREECEGWWGERSRYHKKEKRPPLVFFLPMGSLVDMGPGHTLISLMLEILFPIPRIQQDYPNRHLLLTFS